MGMFWVVEMSGDCYKHLRTKNPEFKVRDMTSKLSIAPPKACGKLNFLIHSPHFQVISFRTEIRI